MDVDLAFLDACLRRHDKSLSCWGLRIYQDVILFGSLALCAVGIGVIFSGCSREQPLRCDLILRLPPHGSREIPISLLG